jgi:hypothetical protein
VDDTGNHALVKETGTYYGSSDGFGPNTHCWKKLNNNENLSSTTGLYLSAVANFSSFGWFNITSALGVSRCMMSQDFYSGNDRGWYFGATPNSSAATTTSFQVGLTDDGTTHKKVYQSQNELIVNTWYHLGFVWNSGTLTMYENGAPLSAGVIDKDTDAAMTSIRPTTVGLWAGAKDISINWKYYNVKYDQFAAWDKSLTDQEVLDLYGAGVALKYA